MKWTLLLALTLAIAAGCEKSAAPAEDVSIQANPGPAEINQLAGTWRLIEYYQDRGDGTGHWAGATEAEEVIFTTTGEFSVSGKSPLANRGFNRYRVVDKNHVELYSTNSENKDVFYYNRETGIYLLFNPQCRENCSRRYKLVK